MVEVQGACDPQFEKLRDVFAQSFERGEKSEIGASVAVWRKGKLVADLWGGFADAATTKPCARDTIANVYSTTKGVTALCALRLARWKLEFDAPVARYWPEFAAAGKARFPVRWLLTHQAGLAAVREPLPTHALSTGAQSATRSLGKRRWGARPSARLSRDDVRTSGWRGGTPRRRPHARQLLSRALAHALGLDFHIGVPGPALPRCAEMVPTPVALAPGRLATFASHGTGSVTGPAFNNSAPAPRHREHGSVGQPPECPRQWSRPTRARSRRV